MATTPTQEEIDKLLEPEQARLEYKRAISGNPEWNPSNEDTGILPEDIWSDSHPESKKTTAISKNVDFRLLGGTNG